jgi:inosose dehydratase
MSSRRNFLKISSLGTFAAALPLPLVLRSTQGSPGQSSELFSLGIVGYSFKEYKDDIDKTIDVLTKLRIKNVALKDFQLPYDSTQQHINLVMAQFKNAGIEVTGLGVIYMRKEKDIDDAFDYTRKVGVRMIIAAPQFELLPYLEKKAKEFNIVVAIHNHGPEDPLFPDIDSTYDKIKNLDPLLGICMDIGHTFRCGHDPATMFLKYHDRIYDVHIKDEQSPTAKSKSVNNGWGQIDFVALVKALRKTKYSGLCGLENAQKDPAIALAESIGHFRGVLVGLQK